MDTSSLPNPQLIEVHHRFALALAWLEVFDYMKSSCSSSRGSTSLDPTDLVGKAPAKRSWVGRCIQPVYPILEYLWLKMPVFLRAGAYERLAALGQKLYGHTGSDRTHRLPFNLYLRKGPQDWTPRHQAELRSLHAYSRTKGDRCNPASWIIVFPHDSCQWAHYRAKTVYHD